MKRLTILHSEASNGWGGQEIRILNEMLGMRRMGHEVLLATPPHTSIYLRAIECGIETFPVSMDVPNFAPGVVYLSHLLRKRNVSIINTHSSRDSWIGSIAGRLAGVKVLRTRHISSRLRNNFLTRLVYGRLCHGVITTGEFIKNQLVRELRIDPERIYPIPTGVDLETFDGATGDRVREELGVSGDAPVLGVAAVLRSWKGHLFLLGAMPEVVAAYPEVKLLVVGEGPMRRCIEREVERLDLQSTVILTGYREDIPEVVNAFDIGVLASYASEGIPQFVLQAMAAGKPVIGTSVGGIPEVVIDGVTGLLVRPEDPESMGNAIRSLLGDHDRMKRMGEAGRSYVSERHSAGRMLDSLEKLYSMIMS